MMADPQVVDTLAGLSLFADLGRPQLVAVAHTFSEDSFPPGQRILRHLSTAAASCDRDVRIDLCRPPFAKVWRPGPR